MTVSISISKWIPTFWYSRGTNIFRNWSRRSLWNAISMITKLKGYTAIWVLTTILWDSIITKEVVLEITLW